MTTYACLLVNHIPAQINNNQVNNIFIVSYVTFDPNRPEQRLVVDLVNLDSIYLSTYFFPEKIQIDFSAPNEN